MKRFLKDENGDVDTTEMRCLKPRVGLSTVMEVTPHHLPGNWSLDSFYEVSFS